MGRGHKPWAKEEEEYLAENWGHSPVPSLGKALGRSENAIMQKRVCTIHSAVSELPRTTEGETIMTEQEIAEIRARREALPWDGLQHILDAHTSGLSGHPIEEAFITHARQDISALLDDNKRLRDALESAQVRSTAMERALRGACKLCKNGSLENCVHKCNGLNNYAHFEFDQAKFEEVST